MSLTMLSCQSQKPMDSATMAAKADSIARSRMQMVADSMMNDCNSNKAMWIQTKADSIYNAGVAAMQTSAQK